MVLYTESKNLENIFLHRYQASDSTSLFTLPNLEEKWDKNIKCSILAHPTLLSHQPSVVSEPISAKYYSVPEQTLNVWAGAQHSCFLWVMSPYSSIISLLFRLNVQGENSALLENFMLRGRSCPSPSQCVCSSLTRSFFPPPPSLSPSLPHLQVHTSNCKLTYLNVPFVVFQ